jgi:hypothetical protein
VQSGFDNQFLLSDYIHQTLCIIYIAVSGVIGHWPEKNAIFGRFVVQVP